jgi:type II secretory pathway pseudopilin PulG
VKDAGEKVMGNLKSERGMSLVEATIILMVLATLTAVIAPSMGDYLEDARQTKAKEDVEALGIGIKRLLRDTGFKGLKFTDGTAALTLINRVDVLNSDGTVPSATGAAFASANNITGSPINWTTASQSDAFESHLVRNSLGTPYATPTALNRGRGWRGSYVNAPIGADPWGYRYYANTVFLAVATNASGAAEGASYWTKDVVVLSAGADNIIQNPIDGTAGGGSGVASSDDVVFVLQGNTF